MRTRTKRTRRLGTVLAAVAVAALMGGNAFTASNTDSSTAPTVGYSSTSISGATINSLDFGFTNDDDLSTVDLVLAGDTTGSTVKVSVNATGTYYTCGVGTYDGTTKTTYSCDVSGATVTAETLSSTEVLVT